MRTFSKKISPISFVLSFFVLLFFIFLSPTRAFAADPNEQNAIFNELKGATSADQIKQIVENANPTGKMVSWNIKDASGNLVPPTSGQPLYVGINTAKGVMWFKFFAYQTPGLTSGISYYYYWESVANPQFYIGFEDSLGYNGASNAWYASGATRPDPSAATVWSWPPGWLWGWNWDQTGFGEWLDKYVPGDDFSALDTVGGSSATVLGQAMEKGVTDTLIELMQNVGKGIMGIVDWALESMINLLLIVNVNQTGIINAWAMVRNASNVILVLVLLLIALFNAIRFQIDYYNVKVLVPRLAIAAVMINLSFFVSRAIIDLGNILTNYFASKIDWVGLLPLGSIGEFLSGAVMLAGIILAAYLLGIFLAIIVLVGVIILIAILVFRHVLLYLLVVFSPLVFLSTVLPFTRGLASQWWNYLVRYTFMGAVITLILYVAASL